MITWQQGLCALAGFLALLSQHGWESKRRRAKDRGEDYIRFDWPVAATLVLLMVPAALGEFFPTQRFLWVSWVAGGMTVAVPTLLSRFFRS